MSIFVGIALTLTATYLAAGLAAWVITVWGDDFSNGRWREQGVWFLVCLFLWLPILFGPQKVRW